MAARSPLSLHLWLHSPRTGPAWGGGPVLKPHIFYPLQVPVGDAGNWHVAAQCTSPLR